MGLQIHPWTHLRFGDASRGGCSMRPRGGCSILPQKCMSFQPLILSYMFYIFIFSKFCDTACNARRGDLKRIKSKDRRRGKWTASKRRYLGPVTGSRSTILHIYLSSITSVIFLNSFWETIPRGAVILLSNLMMYLSQCRRRYMYFSKCIIYITSTINYNTTY